MSAIISVIQTYGYDTFMLLLACGQTWLAALALKPAKPAKIYSLRLIKTEGRKN